MSQAIDGNAFRQVLGHFATGVTVITAAGADGPVGLAVNSFTSVSLEPPLVAFCAANSSSTWPTIQSAGHFCVNIVAEDQQDVCRLFATKGADRFTSVGWRSSTHSGAPILENVLAWIDCTIDAEHQAGDHVIVVGRVAEIGVERDGKPLVFYKGGYGRYEA